MRDLTLIMPYYINQGMLRVHQQAWANYPDVLRQHLHVIIVDDASPRAPALPVWQSAAALGIASARLYRTLVDVRWNWLFCRNLAVDQARTDWVLMTDIDHLLPVETLRSLLTEKLNPARAYRFSRVDAPNLTPYKPHPNSWLMTREMFLEKVKGYDERFSGFYGTDAEFRDRVHQAAGPPVMLKHVLVRYPREVVSDASTTTYGRKELQDKENVPRIREARKDEGRWEPRRLSFPWEQLA